MAFTYKNIVEDITENISLGAKVVVKTGREMVKTKLLQRDKTELEAERDKQLYDLGLSFYEMMLRDSLNIEKLQGMCEKIIELDENISGIVREKEDYSSDSVPFVDPTEESDDSDASDDI